MEKYEFVRDIGSGSFGVARLMWNKETKELAAVKFIERGHKINENVAQEIANHRSLMHPNIVRFKEVLLTPTHLGIVMEYAAGGELSQLVFSGSEGRFSEDEARFFFQQLISGVSYCHFMKISHRDLKLENTLLDGSPAPMVKICDFGYSESSGLHSIHKSAVGTPAYMAPEVLARGEYDGKLADVWSCGVTLYVMLVGAYPFDDHEEPKNLKKILQQISAAEYKIPGHVHISRDCSHLLSRIFVAQPVKRITIEEIKRHPWFLKNLPQELLPEAYQAYQEFPLQSMDEIAVILWEASSPTLHTLPVSGFIRLAEEEEDDDPMMSDVRLPERSVELPSKLQSQYLNSSALQVRSAASRSLEISKYSTQDASTYDLTMSDIRLPERSIIDPNGLHSWNLNPSASQLKSAESTFFASNNLDYLYSRQNRTLFDVSMSDVRPADRSTNLYY